MDFSTIEHCLFAMADKEHKLGRIMTATEKCAFFWGFVAKTDVCAIHSTTKDAVPPGTNTVHISESDAAFFSFSSPPFPSQHLPGAALHVSELHGGGDVGAFHEADDADATLEQSHHSAMNGPRSDETDDETYSPLIKNGSCDSKILEKYEGDDSYALILPSNSTSLLSPENFNSSTPLSHSQKQYYTELSPSSDCYPQKLFTEIGETPTLSKASRKKTNTKSVKTTTKSLNSAKSVKTSTKSAKFNTPISNSAVDSAAKTDTSLANVDKSEMEYPGSVTRDQTIEPSDLANTPELSDRAKIPEPSNPEPSDLTQIPESSKPAHIPEPSEPVQNPEPSEPAQIPEPSTSTTNLHAPVDAGNAQNVPKIRDDSIRIATICTHIAKNRNKTQEKKCTRRAMKWLFEEFNYNLCNVHARKVVQEINRLEKERETEIEEQAVKQKEKETVRDVSKTTVQIQTTRVDDILKRTSFNTLFDVKTPEKYPVYPEFGISKTLVYYPLSASTFNQLMDTFYDHSYYDSDKVHVYTSTDPTLDPVFEVAGHLTSITTKPFLPALDYRLFPFSPNFTDEHGVRMKIVPKIRRLPKYNTRDVDYGNRMKDIKKCTDKFNDKNFNTVKHYAKSTHPRLYLHKSSKTVHVLTPESYNRLRDTTEYLPFRHEDDVYNLASYQYAEDIYRPFYPMKEYERPIYYAAKTPDENTVEVILATNDNIIRLGLETDNCLFRPYYANFPDDDYIAIPDDGDCSYASVPEIFKTEVSFREEWMRLIAIRRAEQTRLGTTESTYCGMSMV